MRERGRTGAKKCMGRPMDSRVTYPGETVSDIRGIASLDKRGRASTMYVGDANCLHLPVDRN